MSICSVQVSLYHKVIDVVPRSGPKQPEGKGSLSLQREMNQVDGSHYWSTDTLLSFEFFS